MVCNLNILCFPRAVISREETIFITRYQLWSELASYASATGTSVRGGETERRLYWVEQEMKFHD